MTALRRTLTFMPTLALCLFTSSLAWAGHGGGFSGGHGGGFSGGHGGGFSGGHGQTWHGGGHGDWHSGGYRGGYGRGHYGGFYGGMFIDPWVPDYALGYGAIYPGIGDYGTYPDGVVTQGEVMSNQAPASPDNQQLSQPGNWYYCSNPAGYYPYVRSCSEQWQRVPSTPPN